MKYHNNNKAPETVMTHFESALDVQTDALVTATIGCAITVHKALGPGFLERAYERALHLELEAQGIEFDPGADLGDLP
jgi:hypothetical protein